MIYFLVGVAGMAGALLRFFLGDVVGLLWVGLFPLSTFLANMVGSFVLGWFTTHLTPMKKLHPFALTAIGTGLVGSFTTFSTFSVETVQLMKGSHWFMALFYVFLSLFGGLFMSAFGYYRGKRLYRKWKEGTA